MLTISPSFKFIFGLAVVAPLALSSCVTMLPPNLLRTSDNVVEKRQLQIRNYDTVDEEKVISASAGVLQDIGFTIDESETRLGFVVGSKERDATEAGQVFWAAVLTALSSNQYGSTNYFNTIDHIQKIQSCVVTKPSAADKKMTVRVTFQRIVWNKLGQVNHIEAMKDPQLYQGFFERLSKAVFLEEHHV